VNASPDPPGSARAQTLAAFLWTHHRRRLVFLCALVFSSSLGHAGLIVAVAWGLGNAAFQAWLADNVTLAVATAAIVFGLKAGAAVVAVRLGESVVSELRERLTARIAQSRLATVRSVGEPRIRTAFTADTNSVGAGIAAAAIVAQGVMIVLACFLALLLVDVAAAAVPILIVAVGTMAVKAREEEVRHAMEAALAVEDTLTRRLAALFSAAEDLRLNALRRRDFGVAGLSPALRGSERMRIIAGVTASDQVLVFFVAVYFLTGSAFVLSAVGSVVTAVFVVAVLFQLLDRLEFTMLNNPVLEYAGTALRRLAALEEDLRGDTVVVAPPRGAFRRLTFEGIAFRYPGEKRDDDTVGPIDLEIESGDIVLVTGGNGAGKSTLLRLLCGLETPTAGVVRVDGRPIAPQNLSSLFSTVFTDFHLFRQPYGLDELGRRDLARWIDRLGLRTKVRFDGETMGPIGLSRGQRKRLALAVALAERRPILLLDEWTADQAPEFRRRFFSYLLPAFKAEGRTVIAVTHDDRHFSDCDVHLHLEGGRIASLTRPTVAARE